MKTARLFNQDLHVLITTRSDADLDSIVSLLGAKKLHPEAGVLLPEQTPPVFGHPFIRSLLHLFDALSPGEIPCESIREIILVGTQNPDHPGKPGLFPREEEAAFVIYDNHPEKTPGKKNARLFLRNGGSLAGLMVSRLREKKTSLLPEEATLLAMGIFDHTDHLFGAGTTPEDLEALGWLVRQGAHLPTVGDVLVRGLDLSRVQLLKEIMESLSEIRVHGIRIGLARLSREGEIPDLPFLVHHFMRMEKIPVFFLLARMAGHIHLLGRSRREDLDMGALMRDFGGKGDRAAGEVLFGEETFAQVEGSLETLLEKRLPHRFLARDIMNGPAHLIRPDTSFHEANRAMTRYQVNALLVTEKGTRNSPLVGLITRQLVEQGLSHMMGESSVRDYLASDLRTLGPEATLRAIQRIIVGEKQRIIPIMDRETIVGVITQTDLLHLMIREYEEEDVRPGMPSALDGLPQTRPVSGLMSERLSPKILRLLAAIGEAGVTTGMNAFVVGGFVRDLILGRPNEDLDIVVEGDGILFAKTLAEALKAREHCYARFGTAVVTTDDGTKMDVVTARTEFYAAPAALPEVEKSSLRADLFRRDFTINTLAIQLNPPHYGTLIDYFSGQRDIQDKSIRIIHNLSFVEDPTRIFRAVRFEARFGFTMDALTERLVENTIRTGLVRKLSGPRTLAELVSILEEENPLPAIERLDNLQLLSSLHPALQLEERTRHLLSEAKKVIATQELMEENGRYERWLVYFLCLLDRADTHETATICHILRLAKWQTDLCMEERREADLALLRLERDLPLDNSILFDRLHVFKTEILLYMMAAAGRSEARKALTNYLVNLRHVELLVRGSDLVALGVKPGPHYKKIMNRVRDAKLNGILETREEELTFLRHVIKMVSKPR